MGSLPLQQQISPHGNKSQLATHQNQPQSKCPSELEEPTIEDSICNISKMYPPQKIVVASKNLLYNSSQPKFNNKTTILTEKTSFMNSSQQERQVPKEIFTNLCLQEGQCCKRTHKLHSSGYGETVSIDHSRYMKINKGSIEKDYQIIRQIGKGSFGQVFEAKEKSSSEVRAIKKLYKGRLKKTNFEFLVNEVQILKKMDHPNIIKLYDIYEDKRYIYVITELCVGGNLFQILFKFELTEDELKHIMTQILSAVLYMHNHNILHRDIKLENVVLVHKVKKNNIKEAQIKLIDFGISVDLNQKRWNDQLLGTLMYMPPQSFLGVVSLAWDIWSCGILCFKLATRKIPYKYDDGDDEMLKQKIQSGSIDISHLSNKSPELKKLLSYMLLKSYKFRISAKKALKEQWLSKNSIPRKRVSQQEAKKLMSSLQNYKSEAKSNLIAVIEGFLVSKKISQDQRQRLAALFQCIDKDHSGIIQMSQFKKFYQDYSQAYNEQEMLEMIKIVDKNKSGKIDFNQFITVMCERRKLFQLKSLDEAFDFFDKDRSGCLCIDELTDLLKGVQNEELNNIFEGLDKDGDNKISKEEFMQYFEHMIQS